MHYYQFNIGDYLSHTRHLTPIEDICYRRALDYYYLHEQPLTLDVRKLSRLLMLSDYHAELVSVLNEFFEETESGYINTRADKEIKQYQGFAEAGKLGAAKRWGKDANSPPNSPPNPPPMLNNNHKPITNNHKTTKGSRLPKDWQPPAEYLEFCKTERADLVPEAVANEFRDYWISVAGAKGVKLDWFATWRNWVRNQRTQIPVKPKQDASWRNDDVSIMKKAKEVGVSTTGKTKWEILAKIDEKIGGK